MKKIIKIQEDKILLQEGVELTEISRDRAIYENPQVGDYVEILYKDGEPYINKGEIYNPNRTYGILENLEKKDWVYFLLLIFTGLIGLHKFYIDDYKKGGLYLFFGLISGGILTLPFWIYEIIMFIARKSKGRKLIEEDKKR